LRGCLDVNNAFVYLSQFRRVHLGWRPRLPCYTLREVKAESHGNADRFEMSRHRLKADGYVPPKPARGLFYLRAAIRNG
jgi:hypothetical protein